jgi:glycosyltransferase involved in cell wall biosynthesis
MGSTLRILHVIPSISMAHGGPSGAVRTMMTALAQRGIRVDVATTDDNGRNRNSDLPHDAFLEFEGQRIQYFPRQTRRYCTSYPLLRWLRRHARDYDLVQTHGLFCLPPVAAAWCAREAGVPYVMAPHGILDSWGMSHKSALIKAASLRLVEGPLLCGAAAVHFMSELESARAAQLALPIRPVVLPLGFDFKGLTPSDQAAVQAAVVDELDADGMQVILYVARIHPVKRVDVLLRAFSMLEPHESTVLAIAGDGEPALLADLKRLASDLGLSSRVRWLGFVEGARKSALYARADIFVLPSASENFGVAIVEAMHAGLPVVVTQGAGLASLVERARAGLVTDESIDGLRAALARLLADEHLRRAMGQEGRQVVVRELSLDVFGARMETFYQSVLAGTPISLPLASPS